ncbi:MAG TPA: GGDEF domain-containing protein [Gammaproteobacteria bacterium]|nr:GGDEF domain-containing protein [Gammaproteobacteria bacterium]
MSYRLRLLINMGMLVVLLGGIMAQSFRTAHDLIVEGAEDHLRHASLAKEQAVHSQLDDLLHYSRIVAADQRLQEYLYIITEVGASHEGLASYLDRQFASLPRDHRMVLSSQGEVLVGDEDFAELRESVWRHLQSKGPGGFYFRSARGVMMAAVAPVHFEDELLAYVVMARLMDSNWLRRQEALSDDRLLFFEQGGEVLWSSNDRYRGARLSDGQLLGHNGQSFRVREIALPDRDGQVPRLWFGISETRLMRSLERYEKQAYLLAILGIAIVMLVGWRMLRNFNRAFSKLMHTTQEMIDGKLPVVRRSGSRSQMDRLVNRFADVLDALRREQEEVKRVYRKLQETAITDSLTGLYNRRYLDEMAPALFAQVERDQRYLTAILLDLDFFKAVNDRYGHLGGDAVLVHFSRLLKHNSRANDYLFRIGGEEFLILNVTEDPADSVALADKVRQLVAGSPANYRGVEIPMSVSAGVSCSDGRSGEGSLSRLMRAADKALYEAKSGGRNRVVVHGSCREAGEILKHRAHLTVVSSSQKGRPEKH